MNLTPEIIAADKRIFSHQPQSYLQVQPGQIHSQYNRDKLDVVQWAHFAIPRLAEIQRAAGELRGHAWLERFRREDQEQRLSAFSANEIAAYVDRLLDLIESEAAQ